MSTDTYYDAYEKGKKLAVGDPLRAKPVKRRSRLQTDKKSEWKEEWSRERSIRDKGYTCSGCSFFAHEDDHPLAATFPDLGMCNKFGTHRFGSASCSMGRWEGRRRPDSLSAKSGV
jgi:hypothetical protein